MAAALAGYEAEHGVTFDSGALIVAVRGTDRLFTAWKVLLTAQIIGCPGWAGPAVVGLSR